MPAEKKHEHVLLDMNKLWLLAVIFFSTAKTDGTQTVITIFKFPFLLAFLSCVL